MAEVSKSIVPTKRCNQINTDITDALNCSHFVRLVETKEHPHTLKIDDQIHTHTPKSIIHNSILGINNSILCRLHTVAVAVQPHELLLFFSSFKCVHGVDFS